MGSMEKHVYISKKLNVSDRSVKRVLELFDGGATVPFIARYRKEMTGGLDEVQIAAIRNESKGFEDILKRQNSILSTIQEQGKLTVALQEKIESTYQLEELEDLYLPYKQKRQTKGEKARLAGLEPLAKMIMAQNEGDPLWMARKFISDEVNTVEDAMQGARDIIAEWINEHSGLRARLRTLFEKKAMITSKGVKGKEEEGEKYADYFAFSEPLKQCASHRLLAILRAKREGVLTVKVRPEESTALELVERFFVKGNNLCSEVVRQAAEEAYKRLLRPSLENEVTAQWKEKADEEAIAVFVKNLRQLLLSPPLGQKRILAIDPGFRTGCKVVCLDEQGTLLHNTTIFPHPPQKESAKAKAKIAQLVEAYGVEAIAIGDGTAGRETEQLVKGIRFNRDVDVFAVREDGASIYSASSIARKEFPDFDVTVRGAVSIGRRLMDPLSELVKIDPKSIGVGQYQHDVNQSKLKESLDDVVVSCVNRVGVDVNTASPYLLSYISGLGPSLAESIVEYRKEHNGIRSRQELKKVKRLGDKAFEQAAGFIRIKDGHHPLDNSSVHPESYPIVEKMAKKLGIALPSLIGNKEKIAEIKKEDYPELGAYSFQDILNELAKPGLDPRSKAKVLEFDHRLKSINDVQVGMTVTGIVTNVTNFGAFVNIGIKENGLIHKSNLADHYVNDPSDYISLHEHVSAQVVEVDATRKRIGLKLVK